MRKIISVIVFTGLQAILLILVNYCHVFIMPTQLRTRELPGVFAVGCHSTAKIDAQP